MDLFCRRPFPVEFLSPWFMSMVVSFARCMRTRTPFQLRCEWSRVGTRVPEAGRYERGMRGCDPLAERAPPARSPSGTSARQRLWNSACETRWAGWLVRVRFFITWPTVSATSACTKFPRISDTFTADQRSTINITVEGDV